MFTVSQLTAHIKRLLEADRSLGNLLLQGEVSNFQRAASGHCYFTLKDAAASIACVMWRSSAQGMVRLPDDGEHVVAHGRVSVYERQGRYQFYVDQMEPAGLGQLFQALEARKAELAAEGLFDEARKRPLPPRVRAIGVVTSAKAAALQDILETLATRYPLASVLLAATPVQGSDAPPGIVAAIALLNRWSDEVEPVDLIVLARGGGSIEELWAFNDEQVVRAIAASRLPVISGVGHETDFTLADLVADVRAPTPTAAAIAAVPDRRDLLEQVKAEQRRGINAMQTRLEAARERLLQAHHALLRSSPQVQVATRRQQVDDITQTATRLVRHSLSIRRAQLDGLSFRLNSLDPSAVLRRGYAIVHLTRTGQVVTATHQVEIGDRLSVTVQDGALEAVVSDLA